MRPAGTRARFPKSVPVTAELRARLDEIAAERIMSVGVLVDVLLTRALDQLAPVDEILRTRTPSPEVAAAMFGAAPWPDGPDAWIPHAEALADHAVAEARSALTAATAPPPGWTRERGIDPSPAAARAIAEAYATEPTGFLWHLVRPGEHDDRDALTVCCARPLHTLGFGETYTTFANRPENYERRCTGWSSDPTEPRPIPDTSQYRAPDPEGS